MESGKSKTCSVGWQFGDAGRTVVYMREMLSEKEVVLDDVRSARSTQIAKDANIEKFIVGKACSGEKPRIRGYGWETFAGEIRRVTRESDWSFQQTPGLETGPSRKGGSRCASP